MPREWLPYICYCVENSLSTVRPEPFGKLRTGLSKGERAVRGELVEPWTGLYTPLCEIILSFFVVSIAISMADSRARGTQNDISGKLPQNYPAKGLDKPEEKW